MTVPGGQRAVRVRAAEGRADYDVIVAGGALDALPELLRSRAPAFRYAVVSDDTVAAHWGDRVLAGLEEGGLRADLVTFPAGERHKTRGTWADLTDRLLRAGHGRDSVVVALGGGVVGDVAGFLAATFMRGVPVVQVPTSVVAMVDASVGGKTGVDAPAGKNLVGAFHPPRVVVADPETLGTLPRAERASGWAEALKHGAILDADHLEDLLRDADALLDADVAAVQAAVRRSVEVKAGVVGRDERERGLREVLNFGHTLGHALEAGSDYALSHGAAVAVGMVLEARLGEALGITASGTADALAEAVERFDLPATPHATGLFGSPPTVDALLELTRRDKKVREGRPRFVLLEAPGTVAGGPDGWSREVDEEVVRSVLDEALHAR